MSRIVKVSPMREPPQESMAEYLALAVDEIASLPLYEPGGKDWDPVEMERYWRPIFDKYDVDKDGTIPLQDLKNALKSDSDLRSDFPDGVIDEIVEWADINHDGVLNFNEFLRMVYAHELGESRPLFQKIVRFAALAVVPKSQQAITVRRYIEEYNCFPPPIFLLGISLIELGIFIYYCLMFGKLNAAGPVPFNSFLIYNPHRRYEVWRYLTYMFIHSGGVHISFNLMTQLMLGIPLEMVHKWWRVMLVYFGGVIAGSLGSSLSDPDIYLAGASGGVYALIAAHVANVILNFSEMTFGWLRIISLLIFGGADIGVALNSRYSPDKGNRTSYAAHFAGALAGLMIGTVCLRNLQIRKWETILGQLLGAPLNWSLVDPSLNMALMIGTSAKFSHITKCEKSGRPCARKQVNNAPCNYKCTRTEFQYYILSRMSKSNSGWTCH